MLGVGCFSDRRATNAPHRGGRALATDAPQEQDGSMKQRIFLGLAPLFVLLIAMGAYAVSLFTKLGNSVDVILRENFRSVVAGQQMKETAERMDSALFFSLEGEEERARKMYTENLPVFRQNLDLEMHNITLP